MQTYVVLWYATMDVTIHLHLLFIYLPVGVFLHILADTLGSVGVIISSLLIEKYGLLKHGDGVFI